MLKSNVGVIGLGPMGKGLCLNLKNKGYRVSVYNRTMSKMMDFIDKYPDVVGCEDIKRLMYTLEKPRRIMLVIKNSAIDIVMDKVISMMDRNDIIIDCSNSNYMISENRSKKCKYLGVGVSGGEKGALNGPSMMVGGNKYAWDHCKKLLYDISAKYENIKCCHYFGDAGAGHFVKMVHNGIEYSIMNAIGECYKLIGDKAGIIFEKWNKTKLGSYLLEISAKILKNNYKLVEKINDAAHQKGTGLWTVECALNHGIPIPNISDAVSMRLLSSLSTLRSQFFISYKCDSYTEIPQDMIDDLRDSLYLTMIVSYSQGFDLINKVSKKHKWNIKLRDVIDTWFNGCIIKSKLLVMLKKAVMDRDNVLSDQYIKELVKRDRNKLKNVLMYCIDKNNVCSSLSTTYNYLVALGTDGLHLNLIQAQRDYFGDHGYELSDTPGTVNHKDWENE